MPGAMVIDNEQALSEFRATHLAPEALGAALHRCPVMLVNVAVGAGKSYAIDQMIDYQCQRTDFGLTIMLSAQTAGLMERRHLGSSTISNRYLAPRPSDQCGALDREWRQHEQQKTTSYAKQKLCGQCPHNRTCAWPTQEQASNLKGVKVIFATQARLINDPHFVRRMKAATGAINVLLLIDEAAAITAPKRFSISSHALVQYTNAVSTANLKVSERTVLLHRLAWLQQATDTDLRSYDANLPVVARWQVASIQASGVSSGSDFTCLATALRLLRTARLGERWRDRQGNLVCIAHPKLGDRTMIFAAGMDPFYVARQLRMPIDKVSSPLQQHVIHHHGTRIVNLNSLLGADKNMISNLPQLGDFFALLLQRNWKENRATLLICRKQRKDRWMSYINQRLSRWGCPARVMIPSADMPSTPNATIVPLIHYGISGVNAYKNYHAAYCLSSYYIPEDVLGKQARDVERETMRFPIRIQRDLVTRKRRAGTFEERLKFSDADTIARVYYHQLETSVVIQAIGRVRYATAPREIITFQASELPGLHLDAEFTTLAQARAHFGVPTGVDFDRDHQAVAIATLRQEGHTVIEIAERLAISERTVRNRLADIKEQA